MELNMEEMVSFIQEKLIEMGYAVTNDEIGLILDLEFLYMRENGFVEDAPEVDE